MASGSMKRCLAFLVTRKMQIKITVREIHPSEGHNQRQVIVLMRMLNSLAIPPKVYKYGVTI